jgi:hypothetical protein
MKRLIERLFGRKPVVPEPSAVPVLRNKPNSMAWIKGMDDAIPGASVLNGRAVKTVQIGIDGKWEIDPLQQFAAAGNFRWNGAVYLAGATVTVLAIADERLEPWKDDGVSQEEVKRLFAPQLTKEVQT